MSDPNFPIYGLTGGIASGKSKVAEILRGFGVRTIDADAIARELRAPGAAASDPIRRRFGTLDPAALRGIIASDPEARRDLEKILHPLIQEESKRRIEALRATAAPSSPGYAVYEAALLVEAGRAQDFAGIILVESADNVRLDRLVSRDGMLPEKARQFLGAQPTPERKRNAATHLIENNGTLEELTHKVRLLHAALQRGEKSFRA